MFRPTVPEELMPPLFSGVGMIAMNFAFVENTLDAWTAFAYRDFGGSAIEQEMPRQLARKIKFLRKCFGRLDGLKPFATEALAIVNRTSELSDMRHYVIHGVLAGFDHEDNEAFYFRKIDISDDKTEHILGEMKLPGQHIIWAGQELLHMAATGQALTARIAQSAGL
jgi:hypothetical protein